MKETRVNFTVSFEFCAHIDVFKYQEQGRFRSNACGLLSFRPQRVCDRTTVGSHLNLDDCLRCLHRVLRARAPMMRALVMCAR